MQDEFAAEVAELGNDPEIRAILAEVCAVTGMGFAAVARVTEERWIACQIEDRIDFGLDPGEELNIKQTICDDVRQCEQAIIIDDVEADPNWNRHPVPILYGFRSYASLPLRLADGSFFGTLCAIDPEPHELSDARMVAALEGFATRVCAILSAAVSAGSDA